MKRDEALTLLDPQPITRDVLAEKYLKPGEASVDELFTRVARALASVEDQASRASWEAKSRPTCVTGRSAPAAS